MIMQQIVYLIIQTLNKSKVNSHRFKETKNTSHWSKSALQQINFTRNLDPAGNARMCFVLGEVKEIILDFWRGTVKYSSFKF